jgi:hypothetical protein
MPDSYGKRQRDVVKSRKAAASEQRRVARNERRRRRELGLPELEDSDETASDAPEQERAEEQVNPPE